MTAWHETPEWRAFAESYQGGEMSDNAGRVAVAADRHILADQIRGLAGTTVRPAAQIAYANVLALIEGDQ